MGSIILYTIGPCGELINLIDLINNIQEVISNH